MKNSVFTRRDGGAVVFIIFKQIFLSLLVFTCLSRGIDTSFIIHQPNCCLDRLLEMNREGKKGSVHPFGDYLGIEQKEKKKWLGHLMSVPGRNHKLWLFSFSCALFIKSLFLSDPSSCLTFAPPFFQEVSVCISYNPNNGPEAGDAISNWIWKKPLKNIFFKAVTNT